MPLSVSPRLYSPPFFVEHPIYRLHIYFHLQLTFHIGHVSYPNLTRRGGGKKIRSTSLVLFSAGGNFSACIFLALLFLTVGRGALSHFLLPNVITSRLASAEFRSRITSEFDFIACEVLRYRCAVHRVKGRRAFFFDWSRGAGECQIGIGVVIFFSRIYIL